MNARPRRYVALAAYLTAVAMVLGAAINGDRETGRYLSIAALVLVGLALVVDYLPLSRRTTMPTRYRLRLWDGDYELLHRQRHEVVIDLDVPGYEAVLEQRRRGMVAVARADGEHVTAARLEVCDPDTGERVMDWAGYGPC